MEATINPSLLNEEQIREIRELYVEYTERQDKLSPYESTYEHGVCVGIRSTLQALFGKEMFNQNEE